MEERYDLGERSIGEVRHWLVDTPTVVNPSDDMRVLVGKINEDLRTRHVYVVDEEDILVGSVRISSVVKYLFPYASSITDGVLLSSEAIGNFFATKVLDLMLEEPLFVRDDTSLEDCARIMLGEGISELPVVDGAMRLVGQINVFEMIKAYELSVEGFGE